LPLVPGIAPQPKPEAAPMVPFGGVQPDVNR